MHILIVDPSVIPALKYGGTERVIWSLGKALVEQGHQVTYLVKEGSSCNFANIQYIDSEKPINQQIPKGIDIAHFHIFLEDFEKLDIPYVVTMHGNADHFESFDSNTIFVSKNHAQRYQSESFVHNGLDWNDYTKPNLNQKRTHFHFLGKASWKVKNLKGAMNIVLKTPKEKLCVLGGKRFSERVLKMGVSKVLTTRVSFQGMVSNAQKSIFLNASKGLLFPVIWHEPFGLAIIESLYYGCPVFGTPYGSLPELITPEIGFLSANSEELTEHLHTKAPALYNPEVCHQYAKEHFNAQNMALKYLEKYQIVLDGKTLNSKRPKPIETKPSNIQPFY